MIRPTRRRRTDRYGRPYHPSHSGRRAVAVLVTVSGLLVFGGIEVAHARRSRHHAGAVGNADGGAGTDRSSVDAAVAQAGHVERRRVDPLKTRSVDRIVASRQGQITAAVDDLRTGQEWLLNRGNRDQTASIVKADILETLLYQRGRTPAGLESVENDTAEDMIEESDNDDASDLWDEVGEADGVAAYNRLAGLKDTTPGGDGYWGETLTTAADQIKLLRQLALPSKLLTTADRNYQLYLMRHVAGYEDWGVSGGVPANVSVALKNGWVPIDSYSDWEVNSIGWVDGDGRDYLIAVLTANDPGEGYGIDSIEQISGDVFRTLKPITRH